MLNRWSETSRNDFRLYHAAIDVDGNFYDEKPVEVRRKFGRRNGAEYIFHVFVEMT